MKNRAARLRPVGLDWLQWSMILLALGGVAVSAYLVWGYTAPDVVLACGESSGCETVKNSIYANLMGIPLPLLGIASFLIILILLILQGQSSRFEKGGSAYIALIIFGISLMGVLYSIYLTYLELFVIYAICRWCITSAIIMTAVFALSVFNLSRANSSNAH